MRFKDYFYENTIGVIDELSIAGDIQNDPTWGSENYDKQEVLKSKNKAFSFQYDFGRKNAMKFDNVGVYKIENEYIFINESTTVKDKIASIEFKKINALINGKIIVVEGDYKVAITPNYRGKGFSYKLYDEIIKNNTNNPGIWASDIKLTPINQKVWKNLLTKYSHEILISNGRVPPLWISANDKKNIEKFNLQHMALKVQQNPDVIWGETWDKEKIRILLKA